MLPRTSDPSDNSEDQPREPRALIALDCEVRQGSRPWKRARLEEISPSGFRMKRFPEFSAQLPLRVRIPGLQLLTAEVRWHKGNAIGCAFASPLHVAVFEHIVRQVGGR